MDRTRRSGERVRSNREDVMQLLDSLDTYTPPPPSTAASSSTGNASTTRLASSAATTAAAGSGSSSKGAKASDAEDAASVLAFLDEITQRSSTPTQSASAAATGSTNRGDALSKRTGTLSKSTSRSSLASSSAAQPNAASATAGTTSRVTTTAAATAPRLNESPRSTTPASSSSRPTTANLPARPSSAASRSIPPPPSTQKNQQQQQQQQQESAGWGWSSVWSSASSVVAQASSVVQQARSAAEEEVKRVHQASGGIVGAGTGLIKTLGEEQAKWTGKVGEYVHLDAIGHNLKNTTIKGLKDLLDAVAPPIAEHEVLQVHLSHDMVGYEGVEVLVYRAMSKILEQIEGGTLMVNRGGTVPEDASGEERNLNIVEGLEEGWKAAEAKLVELVQQTPEEAPKKKKESDVTVPVTNTPLFMRIQPALGPLPGRAIGDDMSKYLYFVIVMHDPTNNLRHASLSQSMPSAWLDIPFERNEWVEDAMVEIIRRSVEVIGQEYINGRMTAQEQAIDQARAAAQQVLFDSGEQSVVDHSDAASTRNKED